MPAWEALGLHKEGGYFRDGFQANSCLSFSLYGWVPSNNWMGVCGSFATVEPTICWIHSACPLTNSITNSINKSIPNSIPNSIQVLARRDHIGSASSVGLDRLGGLARLVGLALLAVLLGWLGLLRPGWLSWLTWQHRKRFESSGSDFRARGAI